MPLSEELIQKMVHFISRVSRAPCKQMCAMDPTNPWKCQSCAARELLQEVSDA